MRTPKVAVSHIGARRYYALPRVFYDAGALASFHTDMFAKSVTIRNVCGYLQSAGFGSATALLGRYHPDLCRAPVFDYKEFGLYRWWLWRRTPAHKRPELNLRLFELFGRKVLSRGLQGADVLYAFPGECLELFRAVGPRVQKILDQNAPDRRWYLGKLDAARERWSNWEVAPDDEGDDLLTEREAEERSLADVIVAPSKFVEESLRSSGTQAGRIEIIPYPADLDAFLPALRTKHRGRLRVLFVGSVNVVKGVPFLLDAVRKLGPSLIELRAVGGISLRPERLRECASVCEFAGHVSRSTVKEHLAWADVLCMPALAEGQSLATIEALASGVPVVCTPNAGSRVRDGVDGTIVPFGDVDRLAEVLERYAVDREFLRWQSEQAVDGRDRLGYRAYRDSLLETVCRCFEDWSATEH